MKESSLHFLTVMYNVDRPNISTSEMVDITKFLVSFISEPNWEALAFPKDCSTGRNHFNGKREILIPTSKYVHARLECCDDRYAVNPQYIFHVLDWIERNAVPSSVHFEERKQFEIK